MNSTSKRFAALAVGTAVVMGTGIAFAAWTASGVGSGAAKAKTMVVTVAAATAPTADLFPAGPAGALVVNITNPNPVTITLTGVVEDPAATTDALGLHGLGCVTAGTYPDLSINAAAVSTYLATARTVGAGLSQSFTIPGALSMGTGADNSCQGQTLSFPVQVSATT